MVLVNRLLNLILLLCNTVAFSFVISSGSVKLQFPRQKLLRTTGPLPWTCRSCLEATTPTQTDGEVTPCTIIGSSGRIGSLLASLGDGSDTLIGRNDPIPEDGTGPILICTRNDVLDDIISKTPSHRREDLVFMQNGYLEGFLEERGLASNTQALIYFAVSKKDEAPIDGKTELNPEGLTVVSGKWADVVASRIQKADLACFVVDDQAYRRAMFEKLIWICAFMLVGSVRGGISVGEVANHHYEEVTSLILEMCAATTQAKGVTFQSGTAERLVAYAFSVAHFPTAIKEFEWRNGFFWDLSESAEDEQAEDPCPMHTYLVNTGIVDDLFSI